MELLQLLLGIVLGSVVTAIIFGTRRAKGVLRIDHSNPEKDVYRFDIDELEMLDSKKRIELKIDHNANLSQK